ncbi:MAG: hypothetical protein HY996_11970 [Micrococcales bacterium]|nr:hypothetical protein [Micrococcales bacterium]
MSHPVSDSPRGLVRWIDTIAERLEKRTARVLRKAGVDRTEWRVMTMLERGPATHFEVVAALPVERGSSAPADALGSLVLRQVVEITGRGYTLTPSGELLHDETLAAIAALRRKLVVGITPEDWATTVATLERIARNLR